MPDPDDSSSSSAYSPSGRSAGSSSIGTIDDSSSGATSSSAGGGGSGSGSGSGPGSASASGAGSSVTPYGTVDSAASAAGTSIPVSQSGSGSGGGSGSGSASDDSDGSGSDDSSDDSSTDGSARADPSDADADADSSGDGDDEALRIDPEALKLDEQIFALGFINVMQKGAGHEKGWRSWWEKKKTGTSRSTMAIKGVGAALTAGMAITAAVVTLVPLLAALVAGVVGAAGFAAKQVIKSVKRKSAINSVRNWERAARKNGGKPDADAVAAIKTQLRVAPGPTTVAEIVNHLRGEALALRRLANAHLLADGAKPKKVKDAETLAWKAARAGVKKHKAAFWRDFKATDGFLKSKVGDLSRAVAAARSRQAGGAGSTHQAADPCDELRLRLKHLTYYNALLLEYCTVMRATQADTVKRLNKCRKVLHKALKVQASRRDGNHGECDHSGMRQALREADLQVLLKPPVVPRKVLFDNRGAQVLGHAAALPVREAGPTAVGAGTGLAFGAVRGAAYGTQRAAMGELVVKSAVGAQMISAAGTVVGAALSELTSFAIGHYTKNVPARQVMAAIEDETGPGQSVLVQLAGRFDGMAGANDALCREMLRANWGGKGGRKLANQIKAAVQKLKHYDKRFEREAEAYDAIQQQVTEDGGFTSCDQAVVLCERFVAMYKTLRKEENAVNLVYVLARGHQLMLEDDNGVEGYKLPAAAAGGLDAWFKYWLPGWK